MLFDFFVDCVPTQEWIVFLENSKREEVFFLFFWSCIDLELEQALVLLCIRW